MRVEVRELTGWGISVRGALTEQWEWGCTEVESRKK